MGIGPPHTKLEIFPSPVSHLTIYVRLFFEIERNIVDIHLYALYVRFHILIVFDCFGIPIIFETNFSRINSMFEWIVSVQNKTIKSISTLI